MGCQVIDIFKEIRGTSPIDGSFAKSIKIYHEYRKYKYEK